KQAVRPPIPGAVPLVFDRKIEFGVSSQPIKIKGQDFSLVSVGTGVFRLAKDSRLTATLNVGAYQHTRVDYWIYVSMHDAKGKLLGTASYKESLERVRLGRTPLMMRKAELDFGVSRDFERAAFVVVTISNPDVPPDADREIKPQ